MAKQFAEILKIPKTEHHHSHQASNNKPLAKSEHLIHLFSQPDINNYKGLLIVFIILQLIEFL